MVHWQLVWHTGSMWLRINVNLHKRVHWSVFLSDVGADMTDLVSAAHNNIDNSD